MLFSVLPITVIVILLHFTLTPIPRESLERFVIGAIFVIFGLSVFLFGVDLGISPLGTNIGAAVSKSNKVWIVVAVGLVLGFFISVAEPDLQILARKVAEVTGGDVSMISILLVVSAGIGVMLVAGFLRIVYNFSIRMVFLICFGCIFVLSLAVFFFLPANAPVFLAISFDASGATTGALTVPFIIALAVGVSTLKKDSLASESDSFGLVGVASTGAIIGVLLMGVVSKPDGLTAALRAEEHTSSGLFAPFFHELSELWLETLIAVLPLAVILLAFHFKSLRLHGKQLRRIIKGLLYTYLGLVIFLAGVNAGFMGVGFIIGNKIALLDSKVYAIAAGFAIGFVTILAEPAVHVLTDQIEEITSGYIKKRVVLGALTIGVGAAVALAIVKIVAPGMQLWYILLPGYTIAIVLSFFVHKLFVGIAFDSGGVASGPMTATFILAFSQGVADTVSGADVLTNAFGMIAMVAMTPIITLQLLGIVYQVKAGKLKAKAKAKA